MQPYLILMILGIVVSSAIWWRLFRRNRDLMWIYLSGLLCAFFGAKVAYIFAEGWMHTGTPGFWIQIATGKSVVGALLGGYYGVEKAKIYLGKRMVTGDYFASVVPIGIAIGRCGCWLHGCCLGKHVNWGMRIDDPGTIPRWPSALVELVFNLVMLALFAKWRHEKRFTGQHFHIYLICYGAFRFLHEFARATPQWWVLPVSGYQLMALAMVIFGYVAYRNRSLSSRSAEASQVSLPAVS